MSSKNRQQAVRRENQYFLDNIGSGDSWRMFRIMAEFVEGFDTLSSVRRPSVTIYGLLKSFELMPCRESTWFICLLNGHIPGLLIGEPSCEHEQSKIRCT